VTLKQGTAYAFVDTNVLLHCKLYDEVDWPAVLGYEDVRLVVSLTVLRELDKFVHDSTNGRRRDRAKLLIRRLRDLTPLEDPDGVAPIPNRKHVSMQLLAGQPDVRPYGDLRPDLPDDCLLAALLAFRHVLPNAARDDVVLLTRDLALQLRARRHRIPCPELPDKLDLEDEPTPEEKEIARLTARLQALENREPRLSFGFATQDGISDEMELRLSLIGRLTDAELDRLCAVEAAAVQWRGPVPGARGVSPREASGPAVTESFDLMNPIVNELMRATGQIPTDEQVRRYAQQVVQYLDDYRKYRVSLHAWQQSEARAATISVVLNNEGSAPAKGVIVQLKLQQAIELWEDDVQGDEPEPPERPLKSKATPASALDNISAAALFGLSPSASRVDQFSPVGEEIGPYRPGDTCTIEWRCERVMHGLPWCPRPLKLLFPAVEGDRLYAIEYSVFADNVVTPLHGVLHCHVTGTAEVS